MKVWNINQFEREGADNEKQQDYIRMRGDANRRRGCKNLGEFRRYIYTVHTGWVDSLVLDIAAIWVLCNSEVKHKAALILYGVIFIALATFIIATLSTLGIIEMSKGGGIR